MSGIFGDNYADAYDSLYREKDYIGEVDLIERVLAREGMAGPRRLLDLGCGTGNHVLPLAQRGHTVVGVDQSSSMLAQARSKAEAAPAVAHPPVFELGDVRSVDIGSRVDAVTMMFAVLCYQHSDADVLATLTTVRRHLAPGGLFIFDIWNGVAVLADRPKGRVVHVTDGDMRIVRTTRIELDEPRHLCHVYFDLARTGADAVTHTSTEQHIVRYFFPEELDAMFRRSGLELIRLRSFPDDELPADEKAWNVVGVARALPV